MGYIDLYWIQCLQFCNDLIPNWHPIQFHTGSQSFIIEAHLHISRLHENLLVLVWANWSAYDTNYQIMKKLNAIKSERNLIDVHLKVEDITYNWYGRLLHRVDELVEVKVMLYSKIVMFLGLNCAWVSSNDMTKKETKTILTGQSL